MDSEGHQSTFGNSLFPTYQASVNKGGGNSGSVANPGVSPQEQNSAASWSHTAHDDPYGLNHCAQNSIKNRKATDITDWDRETDLQGLVSDILDEADSQHSYYSQGKATDITDWDRETDLQGLVSDILDEADSQHSYYSQGSLPTRSPIWSPKTLREGLQQHYQSEAKPQHQPVFPPNFASCEASSKAQGHPADKDIEELYQQFNGLSTNQQWLFNLLNGDQDSYTPCPLKPPPGLPLPNRGNILSPAQQSMADQWRTTSPAPSTAVNTPKQLLGEFGTMERNGGARKQTFKRDTFQDLPGFRPQNADHFQPLKPFSASLNVPNQNQTTAIMYREKASLPVNVDQYSKHHMQQGLMQSRLKMTQREKKRMHMSGFQGEGFSTTPHPPNMRGGDKRQTFSQNPNFDPLGSTQSQRCDGENSMGVHRVGNTQQLMPPTYPVNDPRRYSNVPVSSRSTTPRGGDAPVMDVGDMMPANELEAFYSHISDLLLTCRGESPHHAVTTSAMNQTGLVIQFHSHLEECFEEWRCLSRERRRTEVILTTEIPGKGFTPAGNLNLPKTPVNSKRIDHLILNQAREQVRVASLLDRMASLCNAPLHRNIHAALSRHHVAVCITQARRKEEVSTTSIPPRQRRPSPVDRDSVLMAAALRDLTASTKELRTALWCALQMTLPKPVQRQDRHVDGDATHTEGYSFRF